MTTCMYVGRDAIPYVSKKRVRSEDRFQVDTLTFSNGVILPLERKIYLFAIYSKPQPTVVLANIVYKCKNHQLLSVNDLHHKDGIVACFILNTKRYPKSIS